MAVRTTLKSTTPGAILGDDYMDHVAGHIGVFYNASVLRLTSIGGTANDVTAVVDPALDVGLVAGMSFWFTAASTNTGAMTMVIGSEAAVDVVNADASAMAAGEIVNGTDYLLNYDGGDLRVLNPTDITGAGSTLTYDVFTANGTLTKPTDFPDDGVVIIEAWGGGGGGHSGSGGGGGGGGFNRGVFRGAQLGATETVTIGSGGATGQPGSVGGNTTVGSLIAAYGGGGGSQNDTAGGGGGQLSAGSSANGTVGGAGGNPFGGAGGSTSAGGDGNAGGGGDVGAGGDGIMGGGGGGSTAGGHSLWGGGGGSGTGSAGSSAWGGGGGGDSTSGTIPGGGGGRNGGNGARGEVRVRWIG